MHMIALLLRASTTGADFDISVLLVFTSITSAAAAAVAAGAAAASNPP